VTRLFRTLGAFALCAALIGSVARAAPNARPTYVAWDLTPSQITGSCTAEIAKAQSGIDALVNAKKRRTFSNTIARLENITADLNDRTIAQQFLFNVSTSKDVRDASLNCNNAEAALFTKVSADPRLYAAVSAASERGANGNVYDRQLTRLWLDTLKRSGAGLKPAQRAEFVSLSNQLNQLQNKYQSNLSNDATTIAISQAQADSLPADFVAANLKRQANGEYAVPVNESTAVFLREEKDAGARQAFFMAYNNRAANTNTQLLERAIALRDRLAHLLGYQTWAAYQLENRLAKNPQRVFSFLRNLDTALLPKARADIAALTALKAKDTRNPDATLDAWDVSYYDNVLNKTQYAVDNNAIRQYFPVQHTIDGVLNLYHKLLGIDFTQVTANKDVWNPDVLEYRVSDAKTGRFIGTTYFDLFPRPGKYEHFANFPLLPVRRADGAERAPFSVIVGNWPKPASGYPALLSHDDVVTFFHEFGHNLAALLATAPYETLSMGFVQDFVEAPSQMLENFMWQPSILKEISANAQTGAPLPDALIDSMVKARYVDNAYFTTQQIKYALVDMQYHTSGPHVDTTAVWAQVSRDTTPMPMVPGTHPQASFGHLMGGYDAGYYGYLYSKVYAQDMFTAFLHGGLENPAVGMRYRRDIPPPALSYDPDTEVALFSARPMHPNAFYTDF